MQHFVRKRGSNDRFYFSVVFVNHLFTKTNYFMAHMRFIVQEHRSVTNFHGIYPPPPKFFAFQNHFAL